MINWASSADPTVLAALRTHPKVSEVREGTHEGLLFAQGSWQREVGLGRHDWPHYGLVELIDNNPLVCADRFSAPSPVATLASVGLAPLAHAGLLVESPTILTNVDEDEAGIERVLRDAGWDEGATLSCQPQDLQGVVAATMIAAIRTPEDLNEIDALYEERFARSFFVRREEETDWQVGLVKGQPFALYRLRIAADEPHSLLTIQAMADLRGKAGGLALVHAMNVMAGLEESLGIHPIG